MSPTTTSAIESAAVLWPPQRGYALQPICLILGMPDDSGEFLLVRKAVQSAGLTPVHPEHVAGRTPSPRALWTLVLKAPLILVDGRSPQQLVWYLLGLAHAIGKPVVLLADRSQPSQQLCSLSLIVQPDEDGLEARVAEAVETAMARTEQATSAAR